MLVWLVTWDKFTSVTWYNRQTFSMVLLEFQITRKLGQNAVNRVFPPPFRIRQRLHRLHAQSNGHGQRNDKTDKSHGMDPLNYIV